MLSYTDGVALAGLAARRVPRPLEGEGVAEEAGLAGLAVEAGGVVNAPGKRKNNVLVLKMLGLRCCSITRTKNIYPAVGEAITTTAAATRTLETRRRQ